MIQFVTSRFQQSIFPVLLLSFLILPTAVQAQIFEDFESEQKSGYAAGSVNLDSGTWYLHDALIRSDGAGDLKNGNQSVRIRDGFLRMEFNSQEGASTLEFLAGNSNFSGDGGGKLQVFYSTNNGSSWDQLGDEITLPSEFEFGEYELQVNISEPVRFRFNKTEGGRINIDDVLINEYIEAQENATIAVSVDNESIESGSTVQLPNTNIGSSSSKTLRIRNNGEETLTLSDLSISGDAFSVESPSETSLELAETVDVEITFSPQSGGEFTGSLTIESNAENEPSFVVNLEASAITAEDIISIADAREQPFGTRVTVTGRITVGNEFEGPVFFQDETAGLAAYWPPLHGEAEIGDSLVITGPLTEFNPINGTPGDFLMQIAEHEGDDDITYELVQDDPREVTPEIITIQQMNSGNYEGQLVLIQNVAIGHSGAFQANTNYQIQDISDQGEMRIDNSTNIVGASAPESQVNIVGVIDQFNGTYQIKPRFVDDLGVEAVTYPGDDIPKDETFDIVTWNIEWFGSPTNGPDDVEVQFDNVKTVISEIDADVYALQEIANPGLFQDLIDEMEEYGGLIASFSQEQKTAYLFKRATVDSLDSGLISSGMNSWDWANGRLPLMFHFNANIQGQERVIYSYNIHAKALTDQDSYDRRVNASSQMLNYLDTNRMDDNAIFIGDYNDDVIGSTREGEESPYKNFVDAQNYKVITYSLSEQGLTSFRSISMLDHITINENLFEDYFEGTERIENPSYIGSYLTTTSDHFPVWTRFQFSEDVSAEDPASEIPSHVTLNQNYPNPFNPATQISFQLPVSQQVSLDVYDAMGRKVATLIDGQTRSSGEHAVTFDASNLSSGVYFYRLQLQDGQYLTEKMLLVK